VDQSSPNFFGLKWEGGIIADDIVYHLSTS